MSLQSDYVKATLDACPLIDNGEWEKRCDAWIKKTIRHAVLEELEVEIKERIRIREEKRKRIVSSAKYKNDLYDCEAREILVMLHDKKEGLK